MSKLMPQGAFRRCIWCQKQWFTAFPWSTTCPDCKGRLPDVSDDWPHTCARGHGANHGGECPECP